MFDPKRKQVCSGFGGWIPVGLGALAVLGLGLAATAAMAEGQTSGRAARLSSVEGQVIVVQDGQVIADPAIANMPLFQGAQVIANGDGRAEIQFEDGSVARISPNSALTLTQLSQSGGGTQTDLTLDRGLGYFEMEPVSESRVMSVQFGASRVAPTNSASIRVDMDTQPGSLAVFVGSARLDRAGQSGQAGLSVDVHAGESLALDPTDTSRYTLDEAIVPDSWDAWNQDRDQELAGEVADRTAASEETGNAANPAWEDLDANGSWYNVPGDGYVWSPYGADAGWDPYGYGRWVYYPRYGYVWVSGYDWGYAPFNCGNWQYFDSFGWGWVPGSGGCNPWYGADTGVWSYNIVNYPSWYQVPIRPKAPRPIGHPIPVRPIPVHGVVAGRTVVTGLPKPAPIVLVDRRGQQANPSEPLGSRGPVNIAGVTVAPLAPISPRPTYSGGDAASRRSGGVVPVFRPTGVRATYASSSSGSSYRAAPGYSGGRAPAGAPRPAGVAGGGGGAHAAASGGAHASSGGGAAHAASGGGGGGGHASAGGGGTHK